MDELTAWLSKEPARSINYPTLHNSLAYHQKQSHIFRIRSGLYYSIPMRVLASSYPVDPFPVTSRMTEDEVLAYPTALDLHGKLHTTSSKFIYLSRERVLSSFIFEEIEYQADSIPTVLKANNNEQFGTQSVDRLGQSILEISYRKRLRGTSRKKFIKSSASPTDPPIINKFVSKRQVQLANN